MIRERRHPLDPQIFLLHAGRGRAMVNHRAKSTIFRQGEPARAAFYILKGRVKLTVLSKQGKEAVVAILGGSDFFGEGCIAGQPFRTATATAMADCSLVRIEKQAMIRLLREQRAFSEFFVTYLLSRNTRYEEDLVNQLFNSSEKRLARVLLLLAHFGKDGKAETIIPKISQETLAQMVGTTRSRVSHFMNKFRKLGCINYNGGLEVRGSLLNLILHDRS